MFKLFFNNTVPSVILAAAFAGAAIAEAEPVFPPSHVNPLAEFTAAAAAPAAGTQLRSWYFGEQQAPRSNLAETVESAPEVAATGASLPWYRSAN